MELARIQKLNEKIKTLIEFDSAAATIDDGCVKATQHGFLFLGTELLEAALHEPPLIYKYPESKDYPPRWDRIFTTSHYIFGISIKIKTGNNDNKTVNDSVVEDKKEKISKDPNRGRKIFLLFYGLISLYGIFKYLMN